MTVNSHSMNGSDSKQAASADHSRKIPAVANGVENVQAYDHNRIASDWLKNFAGYLQAADSENITSCFLPDGWFRDVLTFTWNNRSLHGSEKISSYLRDTLPAAQVTNVELDKRPGLTPVYGPVTPTTQGVSSGFTFTTAVAVGQGYFRLVRDEAGEWKALSVFMAVDDIKGHEELGQEAGVYGGHTLAWEDISRERRQQVEENPHALILGAGQTGLNIAARFKQMNIPTIVIEATPRVGDVWRNRYPTLSLHTPRAQHPMLYQPFPKNWPLYTPRDKLADWLEQYVSSQDLIVWTSSRILPIPSYDFNTKRWTVVVDRNGTHVTLHPFHIVCATGTLGEPVTPQLADDKIFRGISFHASKYQGARPFAGKHAIVIGAGNSSADICQDLAFHGAHVTMVQRSSTCIESAAATTQAIHTMWPEGGNTEIADFKAASVPVLFAKQIAAIRAEASRARAAKMYEGLEKAGFKLNNGSEGAGQYLLILERAGGYWLDVGCAELISNGQVKIKQGTEPERFTEDGVIFKDGSYLRADLVVFATGYRVIRETMKGVFGEETMEHTGPVWGLDDEGELRGSYRPSGHPGLWFGTGNFYHSRFGSKQLALTIKAIELGLTQV